MSFHKVGQRIHGTMQARSAALLASIESGLDRIMMGWLLVAGLASALRIGTSPAGSPDASTIAPYLLLILAPFASMVLALRWFADAEDQPQPTIRLARVGRWRSVAAGEARLHPLFGTGGLMVSLLVGILLNVPVRAAEYLTALPAISGNVPEWLSVLRTMMTFDVVVLSSLYAVAFVAALRRASLFPRLLVAIWGLDLAMQLIVAEFVAATPHLPPKVADALHALIEGNVKKVLISAALWMPYLLLSRRVNVTYRHRIPA